MDLLERRELTSAVGCRLIAAVDGGQGAVGVRRGVRRGGTGAGRVRDGRPGFPAAAARSLASAESDDDHETRGRRRRCCPDSTSPAPASLSPSLRVAQTSRPQVPKIPESISPHLEILTNQISDTKWGDL